MNEATFSRTIERFAYWGAVPFFGTLLGIVRDRGFIRGDDDLDFAIPLDQLEIFLERLSDGGVVAIREQTQTRSDGIRGVVRLDCEAIGVSKIRVDLYPFEVREGKAVFTQHWLADIEDPTTYLHVPLELMPASHQFLDVDRVPEEMELTLAFLYGRDWRIPQRKYVDYTVSISGGRPEYSRVPIAFRPLRQASLWASRLPADNFIHMSTQRLYRLFRKSP